MSMEIDGHIHKIFETETFESGFSKRIFVVETDEKYPQFVPLELIKDKTDLIDPYKVGDRVAVDLNIRGNEYNGKFYVNLQAWKIRRIEAQGSKQQEQAPEPDVLDGDDLPF